MEYVTRRYAPKLQVPDLQNEIECLKDLVALLGEYCIEQSNEATSEIP